MALSLSNFAGRDPCIGVIGQQVTASWDGITAQEETCYEDHPIAITPELTFKVLN